MSDDVWALVELMGRTRVAGRISEAQQFGATVMRVDIPDSDGQAALIVEALAGGR